ncbi:UNVERIFIED_CONTAM: hypothetical protein Sangu_1904800 [Sesamum angustifolium]|uniref:Uncharacterized protein n=1 Tax=Sesamum angustifolium TaxID=2727405 RepID=A0AAW2LWI3_9LAMI
MANDNRVGEIEEEEEATPLLSESAEPEPVENRARAVKTKVPEVEVHLYKQGKGPIDVIKMALGGWDQDQLEVREILEKYGFKSVYAFTPGSGRGVSIRFNPRNGRSLLTYGDGAVVYLDGEPKVKKSRTAFMPKCDAFACCDAFCGIMVMLRRN